MKFALAVLVLCASFGSAHPSAAEFNLFCRILAKANDLMYGPDYVYDENVDRAILKDMEVLYNATTDNMNEFRKTLWVTKDFFEEHPPPMDPKNREDAHREIDKLIRDGEKKIEDSRSVAMQVNEIIKKAKVSVAKGIFGENVTEVPQDEKNLTGFLENTESIFNDKDNAADSCGNGGKGAGKTLINDLFCVCVGDAGDAHGACHTNIWSPKSWGEHNCKKANNNNCWTQIKHGPDDSSNPPKLISSLSESFQIIVQVCREEMMQNNVKSKDMTGLLDEYVGMIWNGTAEGETKDKKFFGHSERKDKKQVKTCDGSGGDHNSGDPEKKNEKTCVDYSNHFSNGQYEIPWHNKFKDYTDLMKQAKKLEEKILKNRAALLLLKSQAWIAYSREKDDETSNLDDMNVSNLFDGTKLPFSLSFPFPPFPFLFLLS